MKEGHEKIVHWKASDGENHDRQDFGDKRQIHVTKRRRAQKGCGGK